MPYIVSQLCPGYNDSGDLLGRGGSQRGKEEMGFSHCCQRRGLVASQRRAPRSAIADEIAGASDPVAPSRSSCLPTYTSSLGPPRLLFPSEIPLR